MTKNVLFCIAEEAKPFIPKLLKNDGAPDQGKETAYWVAEFRDGPQQLRDNLDEGEEFHTDFIGASVEECGAWLLDRQAENKSLDQNCMVIADARSAQDETVTFWKYVPDYQAPEMGKGRETNRWYPFRVPYLKVFDVFVDTAVEYTNPLDTYGVYFWRKDELTDKDGIFDVDKAQELYTCGEGKIYLPEEELE
ncbi:hypothetical protein F5Y18DRAFT_77182 [Xylariaceae sp. FL1019]|nr:hypothetical protein F5Y18DRAFT_77182 [Xylariaceae sp. FL1019]